MVLGVKTGKEKVLLCLRECLGDFREGRVILMKDLNTRVGGTTRDGVTADQCIQLAQSMKVQNIFLMYEKKEDIKCK